MKKSNQTPYDKMDINAQVRFPKYDNHHSQMKHFVKTDLYLEGRSGKRNPFCSTGQNGYIALTSAIIISVLIMAISLALSSNSFFSRSNVLDTEFKKISKGLAEACVETALLKLKQNNSYSGNENISIAGKQCSILAIESVANQKIIKTTAAVQNFITNLKAVVVLPDIFIVSWEEVANF